jgi:hypothetical protein
MSDRKPKPNWQRRFANVARQMTRKIIRKPGEPPQEISTGSRPARRRIPRPDHVNGGPVKLEPPVLSPVQKRAQDSSTTGKRSGWTPANFGNGGSVKERPHVLEPSSKPDKESDA